ncbi:MAG TPA: hypothetical protein DCM86_03725, partial [Verrucomicrobiales bacterium]|nr:hypothetical protein [Verrucomicrobiales bacterium]
MELAQRLYRSLPRVLTRKGSALAAADVPGRLAWMLLLLMTASALRSPATNRIQTENALPGTTDWQLDSPASLGWPTNQSSAVPEIGGYASATSVNTNELLRFFVDVRTPSDNPQFSIEIFRLGWYGGLGGRRMEWPTDSGTTNLMILPGVQQLIPTPDPVTGMVQCNWAPSWELRIPDNWVSGIYVAKLTALPEIWQSYVIFVVREDGRSSDFLYQSSFTTFQAYNAWGGRSLYPYPAATASQVSFLRPYAGTASTFAQGAPFDRPDLAVGTGAGEFFVQIGSRQGPAWEYNAVRWIERQGYDVTYCTSLDVDATPALQWPGKTIKTFLSVGHDEYWSEAMRNNVEAARDRGVNLAFLSSNTCFWRIHFDPTRTSYSVIKSNTLTGDMWRLGTTRPEISMIGTEFVYNSLEIDLTLPDPLPTHWLYDYSNVSPGESFRGILGYEIDGEWDSYPAGLDFRRPTPPQGTIRLTRTRFTTPKGLSGTGYSTFYQAPSGAQVFATGSMQWSWALDDYNSPQTRGKQSLANDKVRQMTHNVFTQFSQPGGPTRPLVFVGATGRAGSEWSSSYGVDGSLLPGESGGTRGLPPRYVEVSIEGGTTPIEGVASGDRRIPKLAAETHPPGGNQFQWTAPDELRFNLSFQDDTPHVVTLYCADLAGLGIDQVVELIDPSDPLHPLDVRDLTLPTTGVYFSWRMTGTRQLRLRCTNPGTPHRGPVAAGLFFGDAGAASLLWTDVGTPGSGTRGNWALADGTRVFGSEGYIMPGNPTAAPAYAQVTPTGVETLNLGFTPIDDRVPVALDGEGLPA